MGWVAPVIMIASSVLSAKGQMDAGAAAAGQAGYQAQVADNNRILAMRAADDAIYRGKIAETQQRFKTRQLIGLQRASLASNGVLVDTGTALNITTDTAGIGELDALTIRDNAGREADALRQQGENFSAEAELARLRAEAADNKLAAFGTLLGGASSVASKWYDAYPPNSQSLQPYGFGRPARTGVF